MNHFESVLNVLKVCKLGGISIDDSGDSLWERVWSESVRINEASMTGVSLGYHIIGCDSVKDATCGKPQLYKQSELG